jgi:peptidoglycan hydrolase-like protein with peptidoglycan-binding domain
MLIRKMSSVLGTAVIAICCLFSSSALADEHNKTRRVSSDSIKKAQSELKDEGFYKGEVDGVMGPQTREALRGYQREKGLTGDGRLTRETASSLGIASKTGSGESDSPGEYFENAGSEIEEHYGKGGKALGRGSKEAGKDIKEGEVTEAGKDVGKGAAKFGKEVGKGTGKAAKEVGKGVKDVFDGESDKEKKKKEKSNEPN